MTLRPPSHRAICKPCPGDHPDAAKCDPQNWPTEKNRQKVPPFGIGHASLCSLEAEAPPLSGAILRFFGAVS
jgi:hypothetical protein